MEQDNGRREGMKGKLAFGVAASIVAMFAISVQLAAHHSFAAQYDRSKPILLKGTVTKMEWMNPHIYFYVDVKDTAGKTVNWAVEGGNPSGLYRRGWKKDTLKVGDEVTVDGWLARDGSNLANMRTV